MPPPELLSRPGTTEVTLSAAETEVRLAEYGFDEISKKKMRPILAFFSFFLRPDSGDDRGANPADGHEPPLGRF